MILTRAHLRYGETVLVNAAGSGVGVAAIQIAKLHGARVIASAGSDAKLEKARQLGADECINYTDHDLAEEARKLTGGRGVDMVVENVGGQIMEKSIRALARNGRVVTCGATAGNDATWNVTRFFLAQQTIYGSFMGTKAELLHYAGCFADGRLKPVVDAVFPLAQERARPSRACCTASSSARSCSSRSRNAARRAGLSARGPARSPGSVTGSSARTPRHRPRSTTSSRCPSRCRRTRSRRSCR